jgi:hypothetical protein
MVRSGSISVQAGLQQHAHVAVLDGIPLASPPAVSPPSMTMDCPVTNAASGDAR